MRVVLILVALTCALLLLPACQPAMIAVEPDTVPTVAATGDEAPDEQPTATPAMSATEAPGVPVRWPERLAIYYGWPSAADFGQRNDPSSIAEQFSRFAVVVLGAGLADTSHPDYEFTRSLVNALREAAVEVYGYVDMGISTRAQNPNLADVEAEIAQWQDLGTSGIFWDDVGFEFAGGLDRTSYRQRQVDLIESTHEAGLRAFVNVWNPGDLLGERGPGGESLPVPSLGPEDTVLAESWFVANGRYVNPVQWHSKAQQLDDYRRALGFRLACVATGPDHDGVERSDLFQAAYWAAVMMECDLFQYTSPHYSATASEGGNRLYVHEMPSPEAADRFIGPVASRQSDDFMEFIRPLASGEIVAASDGVQQGYGAFRSGRAPGM